MRRLLGGLLVLLVLIVTSAPLASGSGGEVYKWSITRSIDVAAVIAGKNGEERGVLSKLIVKVSYPGSGRVYVSTSPLTMLDTQAAARIAAVVATRIAGVNFWDYDYFYEMKSDSLIIGGPSASSAMTALTLACLLNVSVRNDTVVTGMINPDGTVGPVGGLKGKLEAVATKDKVFIIPIGQRVYTYVVYKEERLPFGFVIYKTEKHTVDLEELGKSLGVQVHEAASIRDVFYYLTGIKLDYKSFDDKEFYSNIYENVASDLENQYLYMNNTLTSLLPHISGNVKKYVLQLADKSRETFEDSSNLPPVFRMFNLMEATSLIFKAVEIANASLNDWDVTYFVSRVYNEIKTTGDMLSSAENWMSPNGVEVMVYLTSLHDDSLGMFHSAVEDLREENAHYFLPVSLFGTVNVDPVNTLVDSYLKAFLAKSLFEALTDSNYFGDGNTTVAPSFLRTVALEELEIARSMQGYAVSLSDEIGKQPDSLRKAITYFSNATVELGKGEYFSSLSYSMLAIEYLTLAFVEMFGLKGSLYNQPLLKELESMYADYLNASGNLPFASYTLYKIARNLIDRNENETGYLLLEKAMLYSTLYGLLAGAHSKPVLTNETQNLTTTSPTTSHTRTCNPNNSTQQTSNVGTPRQELLGTISILVSVILVFILGYAIGRTGRR